MPKPSITIKEAKLVQAVLEGKNQTEAGLAVDDNRTPESARVWANQALQKATVQEALLAAMDKQGLTPEKIMQPVTDALNAKVRIKSVVDGTTIELDAPDIELQLKGHDRAFKVLNMGNGPKPEAPNIFVQGDATFNANKYMED